MSRDKVFTAIAQAVSDYETHYGVMRIRYADFQRIRSMAMLVDVVKTRFSEVDALYCFDSQTIWFEEIPWASAAEDKADWHEKVDDEVTTGYWVEVPEAEVDEEKGSSVRTTSERIIVYSNEVGFTFYEKHGDHEYTAPWLSLKTIAKFFGEE